jgi:hypothetical protein
MLFGDPSALVAVRRFRPRLWLLPAMDDSPSMWMPGGVLIAVVRACASF